MSVPPVPTAPDAGDSDPLIAARGLTVHLGGRLILDGIDLSMSGGEIVTLIGPNGAGKTTLVRTLLGVIPATAGSVNRRPRLQIGYVPQRVAIDPVLPLTVRRLMTLTGRAPDADIAARLDEVGMGSLIDRQVHDLSGGEVQRVLLARALLRRPDLLVLDEPTQNVDISGQVALYRLIRSIRDQRGCAVLMVSHDLHVVMSATDRVLCINGHVCCAGTPDAVALHPEYARLFGETAAPELAVYDHHDHHHHHHHHTHTVPPSSRSAP